MTNNGTGLPFVGVLEGVFCLKDPVRIKKRGFSFSGLPIIFNRASRLFATIHFSIPLIKVIINFRKFKTWQNMSIALQ